MSSFFPSPASHSKSRRESCNPEKRSSTLTSPAALTKMVALILSQGNAHQHTWVMEVRHHSLVTENGAGADRDSVAHLEVTKFVNKSHVGSQGGRPKEDPQKAVRDFEDWLAVVEGERGELTTVPQTDLSLWFHNEGLAAKTPFAAVVPWPASLRMEKMQQNVSGVIDSLAFPIFFVQTLPIGAKLSDVAQAFVKHPVHLPEKLRCRTAEGTGVCAYTTVPCHGGSDVIKLVKRSPALQDAVRDVPCLLLNDHCPVTPLCLRCLVVAGRCIAAEVACDEVYAPLFGIHPNTGAAARSQTADGADVRITTGKSCRASPAVPRRQSTTAAGEDGKSSVERTAGDVLAYGLHAFVKETFGHLLGNRSYTVVLAAEAKGFDPRVLRPRANHPPFCPVWTHGPLHVKPSPFEERGLRFYILSLGYADSGPFEAFAPEELCAIGDYVVHREKAGAVLPPVLRFLDGHEVDRAAAQRSGPPAPVSAHRSRVAPGSTDNEKSKSRQHTSASLHKASDVTCETGGTSNRVASMAATCSSAEPPRRHGHSLQGDEGRPLKSAETEAAVVPPNARPHRPPPPSSTSSSSAVPATGSTVSALHVVSRPRSIASRNAGQRHRGSSSIEAPTSSFAPKIETSEVEDKRSATSQSHRDDGASIFSGSSHASSTRLPLRLSSFRPSACVTVVLPVAGAEAVQYLPSRHAGPSLASAESSAAGPSHYALLSPLARLQESAAVDASRPSMTPTSSARSAVPAGRSPAGSTGTASAYSSRLPERRLSTAAGSLRAGRRRSVTKSASCTKVVAEASSMRSSPSLSPRSAALDAVPAAEATAVALVRTSDIFDRPASQTSRVTSATKSSRRSAFVSSHRTVAAKDSIATAQLVSEQTTTTEDFAPASLLRTDMPAVASVNRFRRITSSSVFSTKHRTNSSYSDPQFSAPLPKANKLAPASEIVGKGIPVAQAPSEDGKHNLDEVLVVWPGVIQFPSQVPEPRQCDDEGSASCETQESTCYSGHYRDKALKGQSIDEEGDEAESAFLCSSSMPPSISQRSTINTMPRSQPRRISTSLPPLWPLEADSADREESSVSTHMREESKEVCAMCTSSYSRDKAAAEAADMARYRSCMPSSPFTSSNFHGDASTESPEREAVVAGASHSTEKVGGGVAANVAASPGGDKDTSAEVRAGRAATSAIEGEDKEHGNSTNADEAALARVQAKSCDGQPARALLDLTTSERCKSSFFISHVEGADDARPPGPEGSARDSIEEEADSAYYSDSLSHARGQSDLRMMHSTDFESCTSTALSAVSSEMTGRRRSLGRLAVDRNQRPPSNAPSYALIVGIPGARHQHDADFENAPSRIALPLAPVPVEEKSASPTAASDSDSYSAFDTNSETSSFLTSWAPSKMDLRLTLPS